MPNGNSGEMWEVTSMYNKTSRRKKQLVRVLYCEIATAE